MSLAGRRLLPREAAKLLYLNGWVNVLKLVEALATMKQESQFYSEAIGGPNANGSLDFGWCQINSGHHSDFGYSDVDAFKQACFRPETCAEFARSLYVAGVTRSAPGSPTPAAPTGSSSAQPLKALPTCWPSSSS